MVVMGATAFSTERLFSGLAGAGARVVGFSRFWMRSQRVSRGVLVVVVGLLVVVVTDMVVVGGLVARRAEPPACI